MDPFSLSLNEWFRVQGKQLQTGCSIIKGREGLDGLTPGGSQGTSTLEFPLSLRDCTRSYQETVLGEGVVKGTQTSSDSFIFTLPGRELRSN